VRSALCPRVVVHSASTPGFVAPQEKIKKHNNLVEVVAGKFSSLAVDNFGVWAPSSIKTLHCSAHSATVRNVL